MAQAIRAILLASATAATLIGRRSIRRVSQGRFVPCFRDFLQPPAFLTRAVPGVDAFLDGHDLCPDNRILASKDVEAEPRGRWNTIILLLSNDLEQLCRAIAALRR